MDTNDNHETSKLHILVTLIVHDTVQLKIAENTTVTLKNKNKSV